LSERELQPPPPKQCARGHHEAVHPVLVDDGTVCLDCMTLEERRRHAFQCERCGAQYHDDGRPSDAGWIVESGRILCPACITEPEDIADTLRFIGTVRRGQRITTREGREYPAELALAAEREIGRIFRLVRDAGLSAERIRDLSKQLSQKDLSPEEFATANPDLAPMIQAVMTASTGHAQWARDLLLVLSIVLALYFGTRQIQLAEEQVDLAREQIRQDEQHQTHAHTTQSLTDNDIRRLVQAIQQGMQATSTPTKPSQQTNNPAPKTHKRHQRRAQRR
jgi:hypothetical protein